MSTIETGTLARMVELPDFRRDILLTLARSEPTHGQGLKDDLTALRDETAHDGRLYPHLNALVNAGLVEKRERQHDDRSNEYVLTNAGRETLRDHNRRVSESVAALGGDEE